MANQMAHIRMDCSHSMAPRILMKRKQMLGSYVSHGLVLSGAYLFNLALTDLRLPDLGRNLSLSCYIHMLFVKNGYDFCYTYQ